MINKMKLIPTSKIDKIKNSDIKKLYSNHVNKGLTQILSKFSYFDNSFFLAVSYSLFMFNCAIYYYK